jgi:hypothetical protein
MVRWTPFRRALLETEGQPAPNGVGAIRSLHLFGPPIRERVTAFEPPRRLAYEMLSGAPVRDYVGEVTLESQGAGALLTWRVELRPRFPGAELAVREAIRRATRSLAEECAARA